MRKPEMQDNLNAGQIEQKEEKTEMEQIQELARTIELLSKMKKIFETIFIPAIQKTGKAYLIII